MTSASAAKDGAGYSGIVVSQGAGVKQYVQLTGRGVLSFRADDGKFLWNYNPVANGTANIPTPHRQRRPHLLLHRLRHRLRPPQAIPRAAAPASKPKRSTSLDDKTLQNHHGGMVLVDGKIYTGHKTQQRLFPSASTSSPVRSNGAATNAVPAVAPPPSPTPTATSSSATINGTLALIEATPKKYNLVASFDPRPPGRQILGAPPSSPNGPPLPPRARQAHVLQPHKVATSERSGDPQRRRPSP